MIIELGKATVETKAHRTIKFQDVAAQDMSCPTLGCG